jgi:cytochrome b pre-mRNA-processing protein 3
MMLRMFSRSTVAPAAKQLYIRIVKQSRLPIFYSAYGVPDTPDGRFDMIALHAALVLRRLRRDGSRSQALAQSLFDLMFADMDHNLREMGVGDLAVGKRVKRMAQGFYGRLVAYEAGLRDQFGNTLSEALKRNVYRHLALQDGALAAMTAYVRREASALDALASDSLLAGDIRFDASPAGRDAGKGDEAVHHA